jgi:transcriptional regulator with XRE-family HTH domain
MFTLEPTSQGELITQRLVELELSVSEFARRLGVQPSFIHAIKKGQRRITKPATVERAAHILAIPVDELFVAGGHLPPDAWTIIQRRPMLVQALRALDAKLDREGQLVTRLGVNTR